MIVKTCSCGRQYTQEEWEKLPYVGIWKVDETEKLELRNCVCGSTISMPAKEEKNEH